MIKATVQECRDALRALRRIGEEVRLPETPAWRIARLTSKLKVVVRDFEERQLKLFKDAGGVEQDGGISIVPLERLKSDDDFAWQKKLDARRDVVDGLNARMRELNAQSEEIDYDPIPRSMFQEDEKVPADRRMRFSSNDFADAGPFIAEVPAGK